MGSALLVRPLSFSVISGDAVTLKPVTNLGNDYPAMVWTAPSATSVSFVVRGGGQTIDTLALIGSNLTLSHDLRVRVASTEAGLASATVYAPTYQSSNRTGAFTTKTIVRLPDLAFDFVQITISNSSAKTWSAQRLVIGSAVEAAGVDYDAEQGFSTRSVLQSGAGWVGTLKYAEAVPSWKVTFSGISNASWRSDWQAFLQWAEGRDAFLFVPDIADAHSNDVIYGRITTAAKGSTSGYDMWAVELAIEALST